MRISYWSSDVCSSDLEAVCKSVKFGVIVYNRNVCRLTPDSLAILADRCPNLIGFKDGIGDTELMSSIHLKLGERFSYLAGLPTAEIYAADYKALGTPVARSEGRRVGQEYVSTGRSRWSPYH